MDIYQEKHLISAEEEKIQDLQQIQADNNLGADLLAGIVNSGSEQLENQTDPFSGNEQGSTNKNQHITARDGTIDLENSTQDLTIEAQQISQEEYPIQQLKMEKPKKANKILMVESGVKSQIWDWEKTIQMNLLIDTYQPGEDTDFEFDQSLVFHKYKSQYVKQKHQPSELEYYLKLWKQGKDCESEEFQHKYKTTEVFKNCAHTLKLPDNIPKEFKLKFKDHYLLRVVEIENAQRIIDEEIEFVYNTQLYDGKTKYTGYHKKFVPECLGIMQTEDKLYQGEFKNGQAHGFGKLESTQERIVHIGEFSENQMDGWQLKICKDGTRQEGMYQDGSKIGRFIVTSKSGETKEKYFDDNAINEEESDESYSDEQEIQYADEGDVKYKINDREIIEIEEQDDPDLVEMMKDEFYLRVLEDWQDRIKDLNLQFTHGSLLESGERYRGYLLDMRKHGPGVSIKPNSGEYWGEKKYGMANGQGKKLFYNDGGWYEGQWFNGWRHGFGILTSEDKTTYTGEWFEDEKHGKGTETFVEGDECTAEYVNGSRQGKGVFNFKGRGIYKGEFVDDQIQGFGKLTYVDGSSYEGYWRESMMNGHGKFIQECGQIYEGNFFNDEQDGFGIMDWANGEKYEGQWRNGQRHGEAWYTDSDGQRQKVLFDNDQQIRVLD
eukprot:403367406